MKTSRSGHNTSKSKIMSNIIDLSSSLSLVIEGKFGLNSFSSSSSSSISEDEEKSKPNVNIKIISIPSLVCSTLNSNTQTGPSSTSLFPTPFHFVQQKHTFKRSSSMKETKKNVCYFKSTFDSKSDVFSSFLSTGYKFEPDISSRRGKYIKCNIQFMIRLN